MSILIKGMEMPEAGEHVLLLHVYHDGTASIIGAHRHYKNEPFEIVPVPPHGRLIDADAVTDAAMEDILGWEDAGCDRSDYRAFLDNYIEDAPTIIPAERGSE